MELFLFFVFSVAISVAVAGRKGAHTLIEYTAKNIKSRIRKVYNTLRNLISGGIILTDHQHTAVSKLRNFRCIGEHTARGSIQNHTVIQVPGSLNQISGLNCGKLFSQNSATGAAGHDVKIGDFCRSNNITYITFTRSA